MSEGCLIRRLYHLLQSLLREFCQLKVHHLAARYSKAELQQACQGLDAYIQDSVTPPKILNSKLGYFENKIVFAIQDWNSAAVSQFLQIRNPPEARDSTITSEIAACVLKALSDSNIPTICLFCNWESILEEDQIISAIYSLIRQLTNQIDVPDGEYLDFSLVRLQELDGTLESWDKALSIFSDLLDQAPSKLFVIIDRFERLERLPNNEKYVSGLIGLLRDHAARDVHSRARKRFKVLFTTCSSCVSLNQLEDTALRTIVLNRQNAKRRPGEPRLGRSQIILETRTDEGKRAS